MAGWNRHDTRITELYAPTASSWVRAGIRRRASFTPRLGADLRAAVELNVGSVWGT